MKTSLKFTFVIAMIVGFTTSGFSQKRQSIVIIKHEPVKKVVFLKTPKKVVRPSIGTIVYTLPSRSTPIVSRNSYYIKHNNVLYTKIKISGKHAFKVVRYA